MKQINDKFTIKITDFRLSRAFTADGTQKHSGTRAADDWIAPECYGGAPLYPSIDVFVLGCFFFYVLSDEHNHPFGNISSRSYNIENHIPQLFTEQREKVEWANQNKLAIALIEKMIKHESKNRITLTQVLKDEYFQTSKTNYPLYESSQIKPGLFVIFNQELFCHVSTHFN